MHVEQSVHIMVLMASPSFVEETSRWHFFLYVESFFGGESFFEIIGKTELWRGGFSDWGIQSCVKIARDSRKTRKMVKNTQKNRENVGCYSRIFFFWTFFCRDLVKKRKKWRKNSEKMGWNGFGLSRKDFGSNPATSIIYVTVGRTDGRTRSRGLW